MNRIRKNKNRDGKALYTESAEITLYTEKAMENLRHRINVKTRKQRRRLFKMYIKTKLYVAQNI